MNKKYKVLLVILLSVSLFLPTLHIASSSSQLGISKDQVSTIVPLNNEKPESLKSSNAITLGQSDVSLGDSREESTQAIPLGLNARRIKKYSIWSTTSSLTADVIINADNVLGIGPYSLPEFTIGSQNANYYDETFWVANPNELSVKLTSGSGIKASGETVMIKKMNDSGSWDGSRGSVYGKDYWEINTGTRTITVKMDALYKAIEKDPGIYRIFIEIDSNPIFGSGDTIRAAFIINPEGLIPSIKFPGATGNNNQDPQNIEINVTHYMKNHPNPIQQSWILTGNGNRWNGSTQEDLTDVFSTLEAGKYNITLQGKTTSQYGSYTIENQKSDSFTLTKPMVVWPQEVTLDKNYMLLKAGIEKDITATIHPNNASNQEILWELKGDRLDFATLELSATQSKEKNIISSFLQNDGVVEINAYSAELPNDPANCIVEIDGTKPQLEVSIGAFENSNAPLTISAIDPIVNQVSSGINNSYYKISSTPLSNADFDPSNPLQNGWLLYQEGASIPYPTKDTTRVYAVTTDNVGHVSEMAVSEPLFDVGDISLTISASHIWKPHGSPVFTARLIGTSGVATGKAFVKTTVLSEANQNNDLENDKSSMYSASKTVNFSNIPQGEYTLEVISPSRYQLTSSASIIRNISINSSYQFDFDCTNFTYLSDAQTGKLTFQISE